MGFKLKDLFKRPTAEDKGNLYSFERIYRLSPRHYVIRNCSDGFISLMQRSPIPCKYNEYQNTIEVEGRGHCEVEYGSNNFASLLTRIMRGE